jgi:hypothetical protein
MRGTDYPMQANGTGIGDSPVRLEDDIRKSNELSYQAMQLIKLQEAAIR